MEVNSYLLREKIPNITLSANAPIGTTATTVDIVSHVGIIASVAGLTFTLPVPTDLRPGRDFRVTNAGANAFTIGSKLIGVNDYADFSFDAGTWHAEAPTTASGSDFWRTNPAGQMPDSTTDPADSIVRMGQTAIDTGVAGDSGFTLDDLRSRNSVQLTSGDAGVTDTNMTAIGVDLNGKVRLSNALSIPDIRATNPNPQDYAAGFSNVFKQSATIGMTGISNLPSYVNLTTTRQYAAGTDFSGGQVRQDVDLPDGRQYYRMGTSGTTWGPWTLENNPVCPAPMTRAALLALRTAGTLNALCHYVITDFVQGRFLAGTTITMHADSATELSMNATINSLYDNSGWACRYDIDTNNLTMVADNLDNVVESTTVGRVAGFDWGNASYTSNRIQGLLTLTIGATQPFVGNTITRGGTVDLVGRTGGSVSDTTVLGQLVLTNSNLPVLRTNVDTSSSISATGYTAGGAGIVNSRLSGTSGIVLGAGSGAVNITNFDLVNGSGTRVNHTGTGTLSLTNTQLQNTATITHSSTGALDISGSKIHGTSTAITHTTGPGALTIVGSELGPYARVLKDDPASTGVTSINYSKVSSGGYIFARGANVLNVNYTEIRETSSVVVAAGSNTPTDVLYCDLNSGANSALSIAATSTAGSCNMAYTQCSNNGFVQKTGTGNVIISQCLVQGTGRVIHAGLRALTVTSCTFSDRFIFTHNSPTVGDAPDAVSNCVFRTGGVVNMTATGAVSNQLAQCDINQSSTLSVGGTTTGAIVAALTVSGQSSATFNNNAAMPLCSQNEVGTGGALTVTGNTAAKDIRFNSVQSGSTLSVVGNTVAATVHYNNVRAAGTLALTAAAGATRFNNVTQGALNTSGGVVQYNNKTLTGAFNTAGFSVSQCIHELNTATTLTAANTGRASRLGVTNTLPLI